MNVENTSADVFPYDSFLLGLSHEISAMNLKCQLAFGMYCCERLYPAYEAFTYAVGSDGVKVRALLDDLWLNLCFEMLGAEEIDARFDWVAEIDLGNEAYCEEQDGAIDALGALSLVLEAARGNSAQCVTRAAGNILNRVHQNLLDETVGRKYVLTSKEIMAIIHDIEVHPLMAEVRTQLLGIAETLKQRELVTISDVQSLKSRATIEHFRSKA